MTNRKTLSQVIDQFLPKTLSQPIAAEAFAPSNIALAKYWGKRDAEFNLPLNSSLSISLANLGSSTKIETSLSGEDEVFFQDKPLSLDNNFAKKIIRFVDLFRRDEKIPLKITSTNTIPTAAGLASSASGFAALTLAINESFQLQLSDTELSMFARIGSGSASRSLWHGFVYWQRGDKQDGTDSFAKKIDITWPEFRIAIVPIDTGPKSMSSTIGMTHTVNTSPLYKSWPEQAEKDFNDIQQAVLEKEFVALGEIAEANALAMHATMFAARPSLNYLQPNTWEVIHRVQQSRREGHHIYATMDAGANVKLIFLEKDEAFVSENFSEVSVIKPFV